MLNLTLNILEQLRQNNNKAWFEAHKPEFLSAKAEFHDVIENILKGLLCYDGSLKELTAKDCIFRIYRDVRFSPDKSPYKGHFGAFFCEGKTQSPGPGYYLHIEPGNKSFIGGGIYMPPAPILQKLRQEIDYNGNRLEQILNAPSFKKYFNGLSIEDKLTRPPKGYLPDNPYIEYLKLKSFVCGFNLSDEEVRNGNIVALSENVFRAMHPFHRFLREAIA